MNAVLRFAVCTIALSVAGLGLNLLHPGGLPGLGGELCSLPRLRMTLRQELEKQQQLDDKNVKMLGRIAIKRQIATEVVAGRVSLWQAAERFAQMVDNKPGQTPAKCCICPDEKYFRAVLAYAKEEFGGPPEVVALVKSRLENELQQALECGAGELPDRN
ncbi:MAG TPA: hypothetical protein VGY66_04290 [Gemmataceae bacterium]|nr:hypothetical protein [Gemmataceae bacterium]